MDMQKPETFTSPALQGPYHLKAQTVFRPQYKRAILIPPFLAGILASLYSGQVIDQDLNYGLVFN